MKPAKKPKKWVSIFTAILELAEDCSQTKLSPKNPPESDDEIQPKLEPNGSFQLRCKSHDSNIGGVGLEKQNGHFLVLARLDGFDHQIIVPDGLRTATEQLYEMCLTTLQRNSNKPT